MNGFDDWPEMLKRAIDEQLVAPVPIFDWELTMTKDAPAAGRQDAPAAGRRLYELYIRSGGRDPIQQRDKRKRNRHK